MHTLRPFDSSGCFWLLSATLTFLVSTGKLNLYEEWIQTSKSRIENVVLLRHIKVGSPEPKTLMQSTYSKWYESTRCLLFLNKNQQPSDWCMIYIYLYKTGHSKQCNSECFACFFFCVPNPFDGTVIIKVEDQSSDQRLSPSRQTRHERLEHIRAVDQWQSCSDTAGFRRGDV